MPRLFGTDGVRGLANRQLTPELAFQLGLAASHVLLKGQKGRVLIGRDSRVSGDMLEAAMAAGFMSGGTDVVSLGVLPTPAVAYLTDKLSYQAGVMISASHNPMQDNGIKFFAQSGYKLPDSIEDEIEQALAWNSQEKERPVGDQVGRFYREENLKEHYIEFLLRSVGDLDLKGTKIVLDCANGAASGLGEVVFKALGAQVVPLHASPDGCNINADCGSTHPQKLQEAVVNHKANYGFAFDGDADRCLAVDEEGRLLSGDEMMVFIAQQLRNKGLLTQDTLVTTVMSNIGLHVAMTEQNIKVVVTDVGDRYVLEAMLNGSYTFGGEQSGHFIFGHHATTGDGMLTALQMSAFLVDSGFKMSQAGKLMKRYPQEMKNERVVNKMAIMNNPAFQAAIAEEEKALAGQGRVLVRPSGTESLIRIMVESSSSEQAKEIVQRLSQKLKTLE